MGFRGAPVDVAAGDEPRVLLAENFDPSKLDDATA
jgi:hypothetical protein